MSVEVKICGIKTASMAVACSDAGADYVGVVFAGSLRRVSPAEAASVVSGLTGPTRGVGVFVDATPDDILRHRDVAGFHVAQLHGSESPDGCRVLAESGLEVWKAIRPTSSAALVDAWARFTDVDALLVEGFSPEAAGGTGSSFPHDWLGHIDRGDAGRESGIGGAGPKLVLAGGLNARNVAAAIDAGRPDVVDVSSGVEETPGVKSELRIREFLAVAKRHEPSWARSNGRSASTTDESPATTSDESPAATSRSGDLR